MTVTRWRADPGRGSVVSRRRRNRTGSLVAVAAAAVVALAGCTGGGNLQAGPSVGGAGSHAIAGSDRGSGSVTPTTPATAGQSLGAEDAAARTAVLSASQSLSIALAGLVAATHHAGSDAAIHTERDALLATLKSMRTALAAERGAAYGGVRSCPGVYTNLATVQASVGRLGAVRAQLAAQAAKVRADVGRMAAARASIATLVARLQAAASSAHDESQQQLVDQVQAALAQETKDRTSLLAAAGAIDQKAASAAVAASGVLASAESMAAKVC